MKLIKNYSENETRVLSRAKYFKQALLMIFIAVALIIFSNLSFAAEKAPKYQVVAGNDDKAYLVDTTTGFTWILTYRTMATGREPVAIPYKFIKISPGNQKDFIIENAQGLSLPSNGK